MLARHSRVFSPPETHFFWKAQRSTIAGRLGLVGSAGRHALLRLVHELGRGDLASLIPRCSPLLRSHARAFRAILDRVALDAGRDVWVEKTPLHIRRLATISHHVRDARIVHIVRDGRDVVASLYDAATRNPRIWGPPSLERLVRRWNHDLAITLAHGGDPRHRVVIYERLIADPGGELAALCAALDLEFEPAMLRHWEGVERVLGRLAVRPWMRGTLEPVRDTRKQKFHQLLSAGEQRFVEARLLRGGRVAGFGAR
jgi:hypothetical protein